MNLTVNGLSREIESHPLTSLLDVLREELHIRRDVTTEKVELPVTLRRQRAVVERFETPGHPTDNEEIEQ